MGARLVSATKAAERLCTSKAYAYKVIRKLNAELAKKGCPIVQEKASRIYFEERCFAGKPMSMLGKVLVMSVCRDPGRGTFYVQRCSKDWTNEPKKKSGRGFKTEKRGSQAGTRASEAHRRRADDCVWRDKVDTWEC